MARIQPLDLSTATGPAKELLDTVKAKFGKVPNMMKTMAHAPAVLQSYLGFSGALAGGLLSPKLREQIALAISEVNQCHYCVAAHSARRRIARRGTPSVCGVKYTDIVPARCSTSRNILSIASGGLVCASPVATKMLSTWTGKYHSRGSGAASWLSAVITLTNKRPCSSACGTWMRSRSIHPTNMSQARTPSSPSRS